MMFILRRYVCGKISIVTDFYQKALIISMTKLFDGFRVILFNLEFLKDFIF